jgi:cold shock CspA family protein/ribosome-associated translation inhibitor RaiA
MNVPVQIDFEGGEINAHLRAHVQTRLSDLETRFGRITSGRVAIKVPGDRHRTGGNYGVRIHLSLPDGRHVDVDRTPDADDRHSQPLFAIDDAFNRARRQLQDKVRRLQGAVKVHEGAPIATVARIDPSGEFGFLETGDGLQVYFHEHALVDARMGDLAIGTRVTYVEASGDKGPQASTVNLLGKHKLRL